MTGRKRRPRPQALGGWSDRLTNKLLTHPVTGRCIVFAMARDPDYSPFGPRLASASLAPEPVWELRKDHSKWSCALRFHGESYGWEAQILRGNDLVISQRFVLREFAVRWAGELRRLIEGRFQN